MKIAVAVNTEVQREVLGMATGASEAEPLWTDLLRSLTHRGLRGVKLVISDAHEGLKAAAAKVLSAHWQRCRVHYLRNAFAHAGKGKRQIVLAAIKTAFARESFGAATQQWRIVADQLRGKFSKPAEIMGGAEAEVLAFMTIPKARRTQIYSTNPLPPLNAEIKTRTDVVGIFPNAAAITRLAGALLLEQNDEWQLQRRYMPLEPLRPRRQSTRSAARRDQLSTSPNEPELKTRTPRRGTRSMSELKLRIIARARNRMRNARA